MQSSGFMTVLWMVLAMGFASCTALKGGHSLKFPIHYKHHSKGSEHQGKGVKQSSNKTHMIPRTLTSSGLTPRILPDESGLYVMNITLGTPPQLFTGLVNTGCTIVHVPCVGCDRGCDGVPFYDPSLSKTKINPVACNSTFSKLVCGSDGLCADVSCPAVSCTCRSNADSTPPTTYQSIISSDGSGTAESALYTDILGMPNSKLSKSIPLVFGCVHDEITITDQISSGMIGLSYQPASLYSQLASKNVISRFMTICLGEGFATSHSKDTGFLVLGASTIPSLALQTHYDIRRYQSSPLSYTSHVVPDALWIELAGLKFGAAGVELMAAHTDTTLALLDTSISITYLPTPIYQALMLVMSNASSYSKSSLLMHPGIVNTDGFLTYTMTREVTAAEMDAIIPPLFFSCASFKKGAAKVVPINISKLMILSPSVANTYILKISSSQDPYLTSFGTSWMSSIVVQSDQVAKKITLTPVKSCGDVKY